MAKKKTFVLIESKHLNGMRWWAEKVGEKLFNRQGGWQPMDFEINKILETVAAVRFEDLDYTKTTLVDFNGEDAGWLDRNGKFYGCDPEAHDEVAIYYLKRSVEDLERSGWVRVWGPPGSQGGLCWKDWVMVAYGVRLTAEQRNWLSRRGHSLEEFE